MSRLQDALLNTGFATEHDRPMLDITNGGMHGWAATPKLHEFISNQAYVTRPLVCVLLEAPKMFRSMPDSVKWIESLRALVEVHARSIEGLAMGLTVDTDEHAIGGAGEMQEEATNVTRERSQPRFSFTEKYGRPIQTFLDYWIRYGIMDPETKFALLGTIEESKRPKDLLADWYSMTCLFFEPDPLHRTVDKAWIVTNMFPKGTGDITGKRDLTAGQEVLNLDIEFTGISQVGIGVNQYAQAILNGININNADPFKASPFYSKDSNVNSSSGLNADLAMNTNSSYAGGSNALSGEAEAIV